MGNKESQFKIKLKSRDKIVYLGRKSYKRSSWYFKKSIAGQVPIQNFNGRHLNGLPS